MLNADISKEELKLFDKWWDENEAKFLEESGHMSEYHMALVVWNARAKLLIEIDSTNYIPHDPFDINFNHDIERKRLMELIDIGISSEKHKEEQ